MLVMIEAITVSDDEDAFTFAQRASQRLQMTTEQGSHRNGTNRVFYQYRMNKKVGSAAGVRAGQGERWG